MKFYGVSVLMDEFGRFHDLDFGFYEINPKKGTRIFDVRLVLVLRRM